MSRGKTISTNLELRLAGWKKALRSKKLPPWLKPSLRMNIKRLEQQLSRKARTKK
jgi:hypothetical protein